MAVVITVAQQKGGAGKTMLAANLAVAFAGGRRVALLDIDPQKSLARWHGLRAAQAGVPGIGFSDVSGWRLAGDLDRLRRAYDLLIVDSPPHIDTDAKLAIRSANLVLVPLQPSPPDLWAAEGTLKLAAEEKRPARLLLNRAPAAGKLRAGVEAEIARLGFTVLASTLGNRAGFPTAFAKGLGITETAPKSVAADEMRALLAELEALLDQGAG
jgi:chromosome partitioning protein